MPSTDITFSPSSSSSFLSSAQLCPPLQIKLILYLASRISNQFFTTKTLAPMTSKLGTHIKLSLVLLDSSQLIKKFVQLKQGFHTEQVQTRSLLVNGMIDIQLAQDMQVKG